MINLAFSAFLLGFIAVALCRAINDRHGIYVATLLPLMLVQCGRVYVAWVAL